MKQNEPIKFDYNSSLETLFNVLLIIGIMAFFFGLPSKHGHTFPPPWYPGLIIIGLTMFVMFGLLRLLTNDFIMLDPIENYVIAHHKFLFIKSCQRHCQLNSLKGVKVATTIRRTKHNTYVDFNVHLIFPNGKVKKSTRKTTMTKRQGYQFDINVAEIRNWAVSIAEMAGCQVIYSDKIPPNEQLQPQTIESIGFEPVKEINEAFSPDNIYIPFQNNNNPFALSSLETKCPSCECIITSEQTICPNCQRKI